MTTPDRRTFLLAVGLGGVAGLAGCTGNGSDGSDGSDGGGGSTIPGSQYPAIDEWLTETDVGDSDGTYDGSLLDRRGRDALTIDVGAPGNDGNFAYAPSAVVVSAGTEVRWSWTGEGNPHNVEALPEEQLGKSDYEFSSGEPQGGSGVHFSRTLGEPGIVLYHCEPHLSLGMKGGIAVE